VYSLNAFNRTSRYLVSEINSDILANLCNGHIDILSALQQPKCWIIDLGEYANVKSLWCVEFTSIPKELLPKPGVMLESTNETDGDNLICKGCGRDKATRRWQHCGGWVCFCDLCQDAVDEYWHDLWHESQMP
jgi:hypothetical protein